MDPQNPKAMLLALNDAAKERKWGSIHAKVGTMVSALFTTLGLLRDVVALVSQA